MNQSIRFLLLFVLFIPFLQAEIVDNDIMPLSEIRPGMKGIGKTIFKGSEIEQFDFEVLGITPNTLGPGKALIWVELKSPILAETGIMEGMSGSPLFIDGKNIGAVAYGFPFSKKPIAGITPIQDILATSDYNTPTVSVEISNIKLDFDEKNVRFITDKLTKLLSQRLRGISANTAQPLELIRTGNHSLEALAGLSSLNGPGQIRPAISPESSRTDRFILREADAVSIPLISGDLEYTVSGTVTYVKGSDVYLFGHPFYNLGSVNFPLHKAEVIAPFPSYNSSFKLHSTRQMVGTVKQDRTSAVHGVLGEKPVLIPMKIFLKNRNKSINLEIINHPLLNPTLTGLALLNTFSSEYQDFGYQSLRVNGHIFIENEKNIEISDFYSGFDSYSQFSNLMIAIQFFLLNNKEKPAKIQKIDFEVEGFEAIRSSTIQDVLISKREFAPGELINLKVTMQNERGPLASEEIGIEAPRLPDGSTFFLLIGGKDEMVSFDSKNVKSDFFPISLKAITRAINNLRKNNRIYVKIASPQKGLYVSGYEYSQVPPSLSTVFTHNSSEYEAPNDVKLSTLSEYQVDIPNVVSGWKTFKLTIKER